MGIYYVYAKDSDREISDEYLKIVPQGTNKIVLLMGPILYFATKRLWRESALSLIVIGMLVGIGFLIPDGLLNPRDILVICHTCASWISWHIEQQGLENTGYTLKHVAYTSSEEGAISQYFSRFKPMPF